MHPDCVLTTLSDARLDAYVAKRDRREHAVYRRTQEVLVRRLSCGRREKRRLRQTGPTANGA